MVIPTLADGQGVRFRLKMGGLFGTQWVRTSIVWLSEDTLVVPEALSCNGLARIKHGLEGYLYLYMCRDENDMPFGRSDLLEGSKLVHGFVSDLSVRLDDGSWLLIPSDTLFL
ncbi:MAG: hypothetical protein WA082_05115 [Candidatus Moraniibacteriota bacterium]